MSVLGNKTFKFDGLKIRNESIGKDTDLLENFKNEAITQSNIYSESLLYGDPLCPCLLDLFILEDVSVIDLFLSAVLSKCKDDSSKTVIKWTIPSSSRR